MDSRVRMFMVGFTFYVAVGVLAMAVALGFCLAIHHFIQR